MPRPSKGKDNNLRSALLFSFAIKPLVYCRRSAIEKHAYFMIYPFPSVTRKARIELLNIHPLQHRCSYYCCFLSSVKPNL